MPDYLKDTWNNVERLLPEPVRNVSESRRNRTKDK